MKMTAWCVAKCRRRINSSASRDWPTRVMFWGLLLPLIMSDHTESNNTLAVNEKKIISSGWKLKKKNMKMDKRLKQAIWKNLIWKVLISNYESPFILFQQLSRILSLSALATLPKTQIMFTQTMATDGQSRLILLGIRFTRNANVDCLTQHKF